MRDTVDPEMIHPNDSRRHKRTAASGHFGRTDLAVPWEETDMADTLRQEAGLKSAEKLVEA